VPFSPSVYGHCALLIGRTPWDVSRDGELLYQAQAEAYRRYEHRPVVVGVDIYNLEAEALRGVGPVRMTETAGFPGCLRNVQKEAACRCWALVARGGNF